MNISVCRRQQEIRLIREKIESLRQLQSSTRLKVDEKSTKIFEFLDLQAAFLSSKKNQPDDDSLLATSKGTVVRRALQLPQCIPFSQSTQTDADETRCHPTLVESSIQTVSFVRLEVSNSVQRSTSFSRSPQQTAASADSGGPQHSQPPCSPPIAIPKAANPAPPMMMMCCGASPTRRSPSLTECFAAGFAARIASAQNSPPLPLGNVNLGQNGKRILEKPAHSPQSFHSLRNDSINAEKALSQVTDCDCGGVSVIVSAASCTSETQLDLDGWTPSKCESEAPETSSPPSPLSPAAAPRKRGRKSLEDAKHVRKGWAPLSAPWLGPLGSGPCLIYD